MAIELKKDDVEKVEPFDYGNINKRDKEVVEEVIKKLNLGGTPQEEQIQKAFDIKPIPEVPYDKSIFYNIMFFIL